MLTPVEEHVPSNVGVVPTYDEVPATLDLNAVVSFNVRAIRLARGFTQEKVAERLAGLTGHRLPQASISQMERSFVDRNRRRRFNAHDLYLLSKVFDVPIVYFLLPPPMCLDRTIANTAEPIITLLESVFGTPQSLGTVDERLVEIAARTGESCVSMTEHIGEVGVRHLHVSRLSELDCNARLREIANLLEELASRHRGNSPSNTHP